MVHRVHSTATVSYLSRGALRAYQGEQLRLPRLRRFIMIHVDLCRYIRRSIVREEFLYATIKREETVDMGP